MADNEETDEADEADEAEDAEGDGDNNGESKAPSKGGGKKS